MHTYAHALTCTSHDKCWAWDSTDVCQWKPTFQTRYLLSLLPIITAIPFFQTRSHQSCQSAQLKPEELSPGPSQEGAQQGQAPCSISLLIPVHLSFSSTTYPLLPPDLPTLSLLNFTSGLTSISRTTTALTLIHFQSCRVVSWMEIDDSIFGKKLKSPFGIDSRLLHGCPFYHPPPPLPPHHHHLLSSSWSAEYSQFLRLYGDVGAMASTA